MSCRGRLTPVLLASLALVGCASSESRPRDEPAGSRPVVSFRADCVDFDGKSIALPTDASRLEEALGPCRHAPDGSADVYIWDDLGLAAQQNEGSSRIDCLELRFGREAAGDSSDQPAMCFRGRVELPSGFVDGASTPSELAAAGLASPRVGLGAGEVYGGRIGPSIVLVRRSASVMVIGLYWAGRVAHPSRADGNSLFALHARENGCDFDEDLIELSREGNVSTVRLDIYGNPSQGSVGRSMFDMGALSALAMQRGYQYFVQLETLPQLQDAPAGGGSHGFFVGFTDEEHPDVAREFPQHFNPNRSYEAVSCDWAMMFLGYWPELRPVTGKAASARSL